MACTRDFFALPTKEESKADQEAKRENRFLRVVRKINDLEMRRNYILGKYSDDVRCMFVAMHRNDGNSKANYAVLRSMEELHGDFFHIVDDFKELTLLNSWLAKYRDVYDEILNDIESEGK